MQMRWFNKRQFLPPLLQKLACALLFSLLFGANVKAQTLVLSFKDAPLETVLKEIEKKSSFHFIYTREEIRDSRPVTLSISSPSIETILGLLLQHQPLSYSINKQYITLFQEASQNALSPTATREDLLVEGRVVNEAGEGVSGATVQALIANRSTATDGQGAFILTTSTPDEVLVVSSIGYDTKRVPLAGRQKLTISLAYARNVMEETVIKGYYTTSRRLNTGAVVKVSGTEIMKQPVSNALAGLEGRVPGLFIKQSNGLPGANFTLLIRGQNSLRSGTAPLYIIDGIPFPVSAVSQRGASLNTNNPFNTISPSDIESIEVLKDADAIAIYGSRGANGVVLITTKKAKTAQSSVELNFYQGWGRITRSMDFLHTTDYLQMRREAFRNDGITPTLANAPDLLAWDTTRYTDWKQLLIGGTAHVTNAQLRYTGGSALTRFTLNSNYYRETTVFPSDFSDRRATTNFSVHHTTPSNRLQISLTSNFAYENNNLLSQDLSSVLNLPPNAPNTYDSLGRLNWSEGGVTYANPFAALLRHYDGQSRRWTTSASLGYQLNKSLQFKVTGGYNSFQFEETLLGPIAAQNPANNPIGFASFGSNDFFGWIVEPQAVYAKHLSEKSGVDMLLGATFQSNQNETTILDASGYTNDALIHSTGGASTVSATNNETDYQYQAVFARLNYNYNKKYLLNLTGRRDGSSRFGPGHQFASFYAVGLGWIFSDEPWVQKALPVCSYGKLRGSYGTAGNDQIGDYQFLDTWSTTQYPYGGSVGLRPTRLFNADYSWEQNKKLDAGLEIGCWKNRLLLTVDWYQNRSDRQLISYSLPSQTGFTSIVENFPGVLENNGWELEVKGTLVQNSACSWTSGVNLTIARNQLLQFPDLERSSFANSYRIGKPVNARIGYHYTGLDPLTGVYQFEDLNKDNLLNTNDYQYLGTTNPTYYGGWQNSLQYGGWSLDVLFQFIRQSGLHPVWGTSQQVGGRSNQPALVMDRWRTPGDVAVYEKYTQLFGSAATSAGFNMALSDAALTDASFIRLKNVALHYDLKKWFSKKIKFQRASLYLQAQNVLTLSRFPGMDPENGFGLPPLSVITIGSNITF